MTPTVKINRNILCFFTGVMTMLHQVILFPYEIYMAAVFFIVACDMVYLMQNGLRIDERGL